MKKEAYNYMVSAEYDLAAAEHMLQTGRYIYVVFMCHLALEKILKAIAVVNTNSPARKNSQPDLFNEAGKYRLFARTNRIYIQDK
jgi:HEPN domain-containing protein